MKRSRCTGARAAMEGRWEPARTLVRATLELWIDDSWRLMLYQASRPSDEVLDLVAGGSWKFSRRSSAGGCPAGGREIVV